MSDSRRVMFAHKPSSGSWTTPSEHAETNCSKEDAMFFATATAPLIKCSVSEGQREEVTAEGSASRAARAASVSVGDVGQRATGMPFGGSDKRTGTCPMGLAWKMMKTAGWVRSGLTFGREKEKEKERDQDKTRGREGGRERERERERERGETCENRKRAKSSHS